jgi:hypothetical protein
VVAVIENTWAKGLNPKYEPMNEEQCKVFITAVMLEQKKETSIPEVEGHFFLKILNKRIEAGKLPISFTAPAKMAVLALVDRAGSVVALLIDCLNAFEGKTVTVDDLANLYPTGFYDEPTLMRYIDSYLKHRQVKWSELY